MKVTLIEVPYDSGHYGRRMGRGPVQLIQDGLVGQLEERGHDVRLVEMRLDEGFLTEVGCAAETQRLVSECVAAERAEGRFPLVLSGNCATGVGTMAGVGCDDTAVVWLDSHGDLNTPDSSRSGFFDGMVLSMLTGDCWRGIAATVPDFRPVEPGRIALVGARDLDPPELERIEAGEMAHVGVDALRESGVAAALEGPLKRLAAGASGAYVHLDLDVLDPEVAWVNAYQAADGLSTDQVEQVIDAVADRLPLKAAALTALDAEHAPDGRAISAALRLILRLVKAASGVRSE